MNCRAIERLLFEEREDALAPTEREGFDAHLALCAVCRQRAETHRRLREALRARPEWTPQRDPLENALTHWERQRATPLRRWAYPALWAGATSVCVLGATFSAVRYTQRNAPVVVSSLQQREGATANSRRNAPEIVALNKRGNRIAANPGATQRAPKENRNTPSGKMQDNIPAIALEPSSQRRRIVALQPPTDDLAFLNDAHTANATRLREAGERTVRLQEILRQQQEFVVVPYPALAASGSGMGAAIVAQQEERAIADPRLERKVTVRAKGMSFAALCKQLSEMTGVPLTADKSVADDKVALFCRNRPLRDLMRQVARLFGFQWRRTEANSGYDYELFQEMRGRFLEEDLRNRDRDEALLALYQEMERWRPYRHADLLNVVENYFKDNDRGKRLRELSLGGFAPAQLYFTLSPQQLLDLQSGRQTLFQNGQEPGASPMPEALERLFPELMRGLDASGSAQLPNDPAAYTNRQGTLQLRHDELGEFQLHGAINATIHEPGKTSGRGFSGVLATGKSPSARNVENAKTSAALANDPALKRTVSIQTPPSCELAANDYPGDPFPTGKKATSADAMEAIHLATGQDVISDCFTRLYAPEALSAENKPLFEALCQIGDRLRTRWKREENWLQFRHVAFFNERVKEIPDRLLERWATSRRKNGRLTPNDLIEVAQLNDWQFKSRSVMMAAMAMYGLKEYPLVNERNRDHWRFLGLLSASARQAALSEKGVSYLQLPLGLRNQFAAVAFGEQAAKIHLPYESLADATLRLLYRFDANPPSPERYVDQMLQSRNHALFIYAGDKERWKTLHGPFNGITMLP